MPDARPAGRRRQKKQSGRGIKHWIRANSKVYALIALALENSPGLHGAAASLGLVAPRDDDDEDDGGPRVADELSVFQKDTPPATRQGWRMTEAILDEMDAVAGEAGADFIAFHIPFKGVVYPEDWAPILARLGIPQEQLDPTLVKQFASTPSASGATSTASSRPPSSRRPPPSAARSGERLYYVQDNHWNAGGHALAAEILAQTDTRAAGAVVTTPSGRQGRMPVRATGAGASSARRSREAQRVQDAVAQLARVDDVVVAHAVGGPVDADHLALRELLAERVVGADRVRRTASPASPRCGPTGTTASPSGRRTGSCPSGTRRRRTPCAG